MAEKDVIFSSKVKNTGVFNFKDFYNFCYNWLIDETELDFLTEESYTEKLSGDSKTIKISWSGDRKVTDYFKFNVKVNFLITGLKEVEVTRDGAKEKTNQGTVEMKVKGTLVRDYKAKFESNAFKKFLRSIYEKYIIPARINQFEGKIFGDCDEFLSQAKAYLDVVGKR